MCQLSGIQDYNLFYDVTFCIKLLQSAPGDTWALMVSMGKVLVEIPLPSYRCVLLVLHFVCIINIVFVISVTISPATSQPNHNLFSLHLLSNVLN